MAWSLVQRATGPNSNPTMVADLRLSNKEALNSFSYVHAVRPFRNSDYWPFGPVTLWTG